LIVKLILSFLFMTVMIIGIIFSIVGIKLICYFIGEYYNDKLNENIKNKIKIINNIINKIAKIFDIIITIIIAISFIGILILIGYTILFAK